jgi:hypothetical protein
MYQSPLDGKVGDIDINYVEKMIGGTENFVWFGRELLEATVAWHGRHSDDELVTFTLQTCGAQTIYKYLKSDLCRFLLCLAVQLTRPLNSGWRIWHGVRPFSYGSCIGSLVVTSDWSAQLNHLPWQLANKYNRSMSWACLGLAGRTKHSLFNSSLWMGPSASSYELCLPLLYCCTRIYHIIYTRSCVHVQQDGQLPSFLCDEVPLVCTATTPNRKSSLLVEKSYR